MNNSDKRRTAEHGRRSRSPSRRHRPARSPAHRRADRDRHEGRRERDRSHVRRRSESRRGSREQPAKANRERGRSRAPNLAARRSSRDRSPPPRANRRGDRNIRADGDSPTRNVDTDAQDHPAQRRDDNNVQHDGNSSTRDDRSNARDRSGRRRERGTTPRERQSSARNGRSNARDRSGRRRERGTTPRERQSSARNGRSNARDRSGRRRERGTTPRERQSSARNGRSNARDQSERRRENGNIRRGNRSPNRNDRDQSNRRRREVANVQRDFFRERALRNCSYCFKFGIIIYTCRDCRVLWNRWRVEISSQDDEHGNSRSNSRGRSKRRRADRSAQRDRNRNDRSNNRDRPERRMNDSWRAENPPPFLRPIKVEEPVSWPEQSMESTSNNDNNNQLPNRFNVTVTNWGESWRTTPLTCVKKEHHEHPIKEEPMDYEDQINDAANTSFSSLNDGRPKRKSRFDVGPEEAAGVVGTENMSVEQNGAGERETQVNHLASADNTESDSLPHVVTSQEDEEEWPTPLTPRPFIESADMISSPFSKIDDVESPMRFDDGENPAVNQQGESSSGADKAEKPIHPLIAASPAYGAVNPNMTNANVESNSSSKSQIKEKETTASRIDWIDRKPHEKINSEKHETPSSEKLRTAANPLMKTGSARGQQNKKDDLETSKQTRLASTSSEQHITKRTMANEGIPVPPKVANEGKMESGVKESKQNASLSDSKRESSSALSKGPSRVPSEVPARSPSRELSKAPSKALSGETSNVLPRNTLKTPSRDPSTVPSKASSSELSKPAPRETLKAPSKASSSGPWEESPKKISTLPSIKSFKIPLKSKTSRVPSSGPSETLSRDSSKGPSKAQSGGTSKAPSRDPSTVPPKALSRETLKAPPTASLGEPSKAVSSGPLETPLKAPSKASSSGPWKRPSRGTLKAPSTEVLKTPSETLGETSTVPSSGPSEALSSIPSQTSSIESSKAPPSELLQKSSRDPSATPSKDSSTKMNAPSTESLKAPSILGATSKTPSNEQSKAHSKALSEELASELSKASLRESPKASLTESSERPSETPSKAPMRDPSKSPSVASSSKLSEALSKELLETPSTESSKAPLKALSGETSKALSAESLQRPSKGLPKGPSKGLPKAPSRALLRETLKTSSTESWSSEPTASSKEVSKEQSKALSREPSSELSRAKSEAPSQEPSRSPSRETSRAPSKAPPGASSSKLSKPSEAPSRSASALESKHVASTSTHQHKRKDTLSKNESVEKHVQKLETADKIGKLTTNSSNRRQCIDGGDATKIDAKETRASTRSPSPKRCKTSKRTLDADESSALKNESTVPKVAKQSSSKGQRDFLPSDTSLDHGSNERLPPKADLVRNVTGNRNDVEKAETLNIHQVLDTSQDSIANSDQHGLLGDEMNNYQQPSVPKPAETLKKKPSIPNIKQVEGSQISGPTEVKDNVSGQQKTEMSPKALSSNTRADCERITKQASKAEEEPVVFPPSLSETPKQGDSNSSHLSMNDSKDLEGTGAKCSDNGAVSEEQFLDTNRPNRKREANVISSKPTAKKTKTSQKPDEAVIQETQPENASTVQNDGREAHLGPSVVSDATKKYNVLSPNDVSHAATEATSSDNALPSQHTAASPNNRGGGLRGEVLSAVRDSDCEETNEALARQTNARSSPNLQMKRASIETPPAKLQQINPAVIFKNDGVSVPVKNAGDTPLNTICYDTYEKVYPGFHESTRLAVNRECLFGDEQQKAEEFKINYNLLPNDYAGIGLQMLPIPSSCIVTTNERSRFVAPKGLITKKVVNKK